MANKKNTRRALITSIISMILCCAMLVGTTFAWFTDTVTSGNNIIKSGTLDVELEYSDDNATWKDASEGAIFDYEYWEPGYTQAKYVKISNVGNLALRYKLNITPNITVAEGEADLAEVIDVYCIPADQAANLTREQVLAADPVGTLAELMADVDGAAYGVLLPDASVASGDVTLNEADAALVAEGSVSYCIVLHMQEEAGNEYQNLSVGEGFSVQLLAAQYTWENDSFDNMYDDGSAYTELPKAIVTYGGEYVNVAGLEWNETYSPVQDSTVTLDTAYVFETTESYDEAQENAYAKWHADFAITFDRDVTAADGVGLAGNYGSYGWIGAKLDADLIAALEEAGLAENGTIKAGTSIRLLQLMETPMNYEELCLLVQKFICGAWADSNKEDLTMTVELRLYEVEEPSESNNNSWNTEVTPENYEVVGKYAYTFRAVESDLPVASVSSADEYVGKTDLVWNNNWSPVQNAVLETAYVFQTTESYDDAQNSPYAEWNADFAISFSRDVTAADEVGIAGNYGSYNWIGVNVDADLISQLESAGLAEDGAIKEGTTLKLMELMGKTVNYEELCLLVNTFTCGAWAGSNAEGLTMTVELRLTNTTTNEYHVISTIDYTFDAE